MANQENHGRWYNIVEKLFSRGLLGDILSTPSNIVGQILSSPATTTQENDQPANTPVAASTQAAAAAAPAATTQAAAAAPVATTKAAAAQQPAATPAASPKQEQPQQQQQTPSPAAQAPATTQQAVQQPVASTSAAAPTVAATSASRADDVLTTSPPAAAETVPPTAENAASSQVSVQPVSLSQTGAAGAASVGGAVATKPGATSPTQTQQAPAPGTTSNTNNQGPLVATGVVLGIVVLLGLSLLIFWCLRRKKRAAQHDHAAVPLGSPINEYAPDNRFRDHVSRGYSAMSETHSIASGEMITHHPHPEQLAFSLAHSLGGGDGEAHGPIPFEAQPFSYAQAQQYVQSLAETGTFGFPPPPPIPQPSPIRIFRWPTRSSRSGASTPSAFSGFRSNKTASRRQSRTSRNHQSRTSRSTMSSILWHGRRDIIARSTLNQPPVLPNPSFASNNGSESPMPEGIHTPVLDWLHWIRGHQQVEPDPEMNHRKSFASTTESSVSEVSDVRSTSTASSGVFSPTLHSWQPPTSTPCATPEDRLNTDPFQYIPLPLFKRASSNLSGSPSTISPSTISPSTVSPGGLNIPYRG
ncbi:hypothetical protein LZ30DRAFT_65122 [Colletotrichum cereale]|nr:hypothetical protein LZ30DRAFT_65122 [Colletotrichum cereale]